MRSVGSAFKYIFLPGLTLFLAYILIPRSYPVRSFETLPDTKYWDLPTGSRIGYSVIEAKGPKKTSPIIYLHGGPGGAIGESTLSMLHPFSDIGYDVIAYDQIGSGSSERLGDIEEYTVDRHRADLEAIISKTGAEKVILLGQSWGSILATFFAVSSPESVEKIIMTGPGPVFPLNEALATLKAPDSLNLKSPSFSNAQGNKEVYTFRDKCIRWFAYRTGKKLASDEEVDDFFTHLNNQLNRSALYDVSKLKESTGGGGYYSHIMTYRSLHNMVDTREKMKDLRVPVLLLRGQYDNQGWGYVQEYLQLLPMVHMEIIPKAGHFIHEEQADLYYERIFTFLKGKKTERIPASL